MSVDRPVLKLGVAGGLERPTPFDASASAVRMNTYKGPARTRRSSALLPFLLLSSLQALAGTLLELGNSRCSGLY